MWGKDRPAPSLTRAYLIGLHTRQAAPTINAITVEMTPVIRVFTSGAYSMRSESGLAVLEPVEPSVLARNCDHARAYGHRPGDRVLQYKLQKWP